MGMSDWVCIDVSSVCVSADAAKGEVMQHQKVKGKYD
jgi:hypothetical protein